jgi:ATP-dependent DNA helicase RecG
VRIRGRDFQFVHPEHEILSPAGEALSGGRIVPVYDLTAGLTQKLLRLWVRRALDAVVSELRDPLPEALRSRLGLPELGWALERIHFPAAGPETDLARDRLAFDEFLTLQLALGLVRRRRARPHTARPLRSTGRHLDVLRSRLPFRLTGGQEEVLREILHDLARDEPMNRLLQGDVGSGKTVVAALACLAAVEAGAQTAYLAPTEILALQQARLLEEWFAPLGVTTALLLGRTRAAERRKLLPELASGKVRVVVGTHALLEDPVEFDSLGLVVVDEQHRFGVLQRARLLRKSRGGDSHEPGVWPHCLVMSATPIPRTLSLTLHGDLDISLLREMPAGRMPPRTRLVEEEKRDDLLIWVGERLRRGERAFFVYPLVEESEQFDLRDATNMAETLSTHPALAGVGVGLLHGRMKGEDKEEAIARFREGATPCLVTTTVVEVGVDIPQATIMVVEHPERFGLSQLHQLRGRVGRGGGVSHMFLMKPKGARESVRRLRVLVRESDGFRVAEEDLRLRGPGEVLGTAQHGLPEFKAGDLIRDPALLLRAREEAERILRDDPTLAHPGHAALRAYVLARFGSRMALADVG